MITNVSPDYFKKEYLFSEYESILLEYPFLSFVFECIYGSELHNANIPSIPFVQISIQHSGKEKQWFIDKISFDIHFTPSEQSD